jgi:hypothetical protein
MGTDSYGIVFRKYMLFKCYELLRMIMGTLGLSKSMTSFYVLNTVPAGQATAFCYMRVKGFS